MIKSIASTSLLQPADTTAQTGSAISSDAPTDSRIWKTATEFESMTINQFLAPMFDTVDLSKSPFGGGVGESSFKPMLVTEMAKQIENNGGLGLSKAIYKQMLEIQEKSR